MSLSEQKIRQSNRDTTLILMPIVAIIGKLIQFFILPDKYFYDSSRMQSMMNKDGKMQAWGDAYETVVDIFSKINYFGFTKIEQWSIELGIVFTILLMIIISRVKEMSLMESIYTLMATGLLNIYVFVLAKEPIQMFFFMCIMVIVFLPIKNPVIKLLGGSLIYYWESNTFREYYIMMAVMSLVLFFIFYILKKMKKIRLIHVLIVVVFCYAVMFAFVYASQFAMPEEYKTVMTVRDEYANQDANTTIANIWPVEGNYGLFMANYVICSVRMMIPVELIVKSPVYFPCFIYQIWILVYWIKGLKNLKRLNNDVLLALTFFTAYLFGSFVFEPDFGSWVRHEAATFPLFHIMAYEYLGRRDIAIRREIYYETTNV